MTPPKQTLREKMDLIINDEIYRQRIYDAIQAVKKIKSAQLEKKV